MARARERHRLLALAGRLTLGRPRAHAPDPVLVVAVADDERERRTERPPVAEPGEHLDLVGLDLLPRGAPVALLSPPQVVLDPVFVQKEARGHPGHDRDERRTVRLPGGGERQRHGERLRTAALITSFGAGSPVQRSNDAAPCPTKTSRPSTTRSQPAARAASISAVSAPSGL